MTDQQIIPLPDQNLVLAESGPMRLFIQAWFGENPLLKLGVEAAERLPDVLLAEGLLDLSGNVGRGDVVPARSGQVAGAAG